MALVKPTIIAPDSSYWATWIDDALGSNPANRISAMALHGRLISTGRIPLLSLHHLEELLPIESGSNARNRVSFIQSLPLIAWMRMPQKQNGLGAVMDILASEAIAYDQGCRSLVDVRNQVRAKLMRTGTGAAAIGDEGWVWDVARSMLVEQRPHLGMVAALRGMKTIADEQTIGRLSQQMRREPGERSAVLGRVHADAYDRSMKADPRRDPSEARAFADEFVRRTLALLPPENASPREVLVHALVTQGLDAEEVVDDARLRDLQELATFRSHLRIVAELTNLPFERLKRVRMECLPSWRIERALKLHGQSRAKRPGSDVTDGHLAVLAAYTDVLYVDKRTHEDFRRIGPKDPELTAIIGNVLKARHYTLLAGSD